MYNVLGPRKILIHNFPTAVQRVGLVVFRALWAKSAANGIGIGFVYVPLSDFPGIPFPDGRFPGNPGKPGNYKFFAVYINIWQQTPTFLTFSQSCR